MSEPIKRRRIGLYGPLIAVLILAAAWSGVWFYAAGRADATVSAWIDREASLGRRYTCGERKTAGYPFRIEMRCTNLVIDLDTPDGPVNLRAPHLLAMAQVYQPTLVIAEATGPMAVKGPDIDYVATWTLLQASLRGRPADPQRFSLAVTAPALAAANTAEPFARAAKFEFHARRREGAAAPEPFDLALRFDALNLPAAPAAIAAQPINAEIQAALLGVKDLRPRPMPARLREWQAAGGRLEITQARIAQGEALGVGQGSLGLTADGQIDGTITLRVAGLETVAPLLFEPNQRRAQAGFVAGLNMLSRGEIEGKRAVTVPLSFRDGRVLFGPIPIGRTRPLF